MERRGDGRGVAAAAFRRAAAAYNRGDLTRAVADFTAGLATDPASSHAFLFRGLARLRLGHEADALADFTAALDLDPTCADALWARARVAAEQGRHADAIRDCGRFIALRPDDDRAYALRGENRARAGDWAGCLADYRRAAELRPGDYKHLNRLAWVLATCPDESLQALPEALELAERASRLSCHADPLVLDTLQVARDRISRTGP